MTRLYQAVVLLTCIVFSWPHSASQAAAAEPNAGQQVEMKFKTTDGAEVPYLLYLPDNYDGKTALPVMLFLHGRGESDGPLSVVAKWGPPLLVERGEKMPFIIASPQCPKEDNWRSDVQQKRLSQLLTHVVDKYHGNPKQLFLTGLSMGGSGSWRMAADHPELFAAVIPICGDGNPDDAAKLKALPIWVFCGDQDRVHASNVKMVDAIKAAGSQTVRFTSLEHIGHNSWSAAYATPELATWMLKQTK